MTTPLENLVLQVLVRPYKNRYVGMCLEMGLYFEGDTFEEAQQQLFSAISLAMEAIGNDPKLLPSLSVGMNWDYTVFFYWSVLLYLLRGLVKAMGEFFVAKGNATSIGNLAAACG